MFFRLGVRCYNATFFDDSSEFTQTGITATVPAKSRKLFTFPAKTVLPGQARFQFYCVSGKFSDAAEITIPVYSPFTSASYVTMGDMGDENDAILQSVEIPSNALPQFGKIDVTTQKNIF